MSAWHAFGLSMVVLFVKMFVIALVQGTQRLKHRTFAKPEDAAHWGKGEAVSADEEPPLVRLGQAALRNDLENIPIFGFLAIAYIQLGAWPLGASIYFGIFVVSRVAHTAFYLRPTQPHRNRAYLLGQLVCFILSGHIIWAVVQSL